MSTILHRPSPNHGDRRGGLKPEYIVLHYTGMETAQEALDRLTSPSSAVSAHYVIDEDGTLYQLVDESRRAWHCGESFWRGDTDINSRSIGIELVNKGHAWGYTPFPQKQMDCLRALLIGIIDRHTMNPRECLLAHSDIAPQRREDPGEYFPWEVLARDGLGAWPQVMDEDYREVVNPQAIDREVQQRLSFMGYHCPQHGDYDRAMRFALLAFQRRFEPNNLTGTPERETIARLRALTRGH